MPRSGRNPPGLVAFEGLLPATSSPFQIRVEILDWDFINYPRIELLSDPEGFRPHVDALGGLCYLGPGSVIFDRLQPLGNIELCLKAAALELNRQASPDYRHDESRYEFARYWSRDCTLLGTVCPTKRLHPTLAGFIGTLPFLIADEATEIERIRTAVMSGSGEKKEGDDRISPSWIIRLDSDPWLDRNGPPNTWGELWTWIEMVDPRGADCLRSVVNRKDFAETDRGVIIFNHESKFFGVMTLIPKATRETWALMKLKRRSPSELANYLKKHAGARIEIVTFEVMEVGADFIHRRNLGMAESLAGLKIHVVGAGAIGGFLAQQLSRLGAGASGGELRIIDPEILGSENIGRHILGVDSLLQPKATAVANFLARQFPMSNITGLVTDARIVKDLFKCDFLVEATGEESLSLVLNEMHQYLLTSESSVPPMLFAWVLGNGEVVQALLSDGGDHACYDCLNLPDRDGPDRQRFRVLKAPPDTKFIGCHTMRPYAVTAPTVAAALATQIVADWKAGHPKPRFRTLYLGRGDHLHDIKKDADPKRLDRCLTCSKI